MAFGFVLIPNPSPLFFGKSQKHSREGDASPTSSQTYKQYQPPRLKPNLASVPLFANLKELVERGQGFFSHSFSEG